MDKQTFLVLGIVLISGCIGGGPIVTTPTGFGLEITDFSGDQTSLTELKNLRLTMSVENQGSSLVSKDASLILLNVPSGWEIVSGSGGQARIYIITPDDPNT